VKPLGQVETGPIAADRRQHAGEANAFCSFFWHLNLPLAAGNTGASRLGREVVALTICHRDLSSISTFVKAGQPSFELIDQVNSK
jgi:hypothetical protein